MLSPDQKKNDPKFKEYGQNTINSIAEFFEHDLNEISAEWG